MISTDLTHSVFLMHLTPLRKMGQRKSHLEVEREVLDPQRIDMKLRSKGGHKMYFSGSKIENSA